MSDTPRTDAACGWPVGHHGRIESSDLRWSPDGPFVHSSVARELERENAALRAELEAQAVVNGKGGEREAKLLAEVAALRADKERLDWLIKNQIGVAYGAVSFEAFDKITRVAIDAARKEAQP